MHPAVSAATVPRALHVDHSPGRSVTVVAGRTALVTYRYRDEPRLHPVHTLGGEPAVAGAVGWTPPRITEHPLLRTAGAEHGRLTELAATDAAVTVAHRLTWTDRCGRAAVDEWRALTAVAADSDTWVLLFENTVTNVAGAAFTIAAGGGGLQWPTPAGAAFTLARGAGLRWPTPAGYAVLVLVDDSANPAPGMAGSPVAPGQTLAFRHAAVIASADQHAEALAGLGRVVLAAGAWHGCAASHARSTRRVPAIGPATPPGRGRRPRR